MHSAKLSLEEYSRLCQKTDISPNYHPKFVEYYFGQLKKRPNIIGKYNNEGQLIAAFPVLFRQIFPNPIHRKVLGQSYKKLGDIGEPEALFPVFFCDSKISLNYLSPTTSPILTNKIRSFGNCSFKNIAIALERKHKKLTHRQKAFFEDGGNAYFTDTLDKKEFADIFINLHCKRWGYSNYDLRYVHDQILHLYENVFGVILAYKEEPVAAQLCYKAIGKSIYYIDFINSGVKIEKNNDISYGSIMMLCSLRKAEENARALGMALRYSFGYCSDNQPYKAIWTRSEATFIGF